MEQPTPRSEVAVSPIVVGFGEVLWDVLPSGEQLGGAPANFACHASSLGADGWLVSAVGIDSLGDRAIEALNKKNVNTRCVSKSKLSTGRVIVTVSGAGQPEYEIQKKVAWDCIALTQDCSELACKCHAVCFGTLAQRGEQSHKSIMSFLASTSPNCLRVFDVNLRQDFYSAEIVHKSLQQANVLKLNQEELPVVCRLMEVEFETGFEVAALRMLQAKFDLNLVAWTKGAEGSVLFDGQTVDVADGVKVDVRDTVGAGDAFTAALVTGLLRSESLASINENAGRIAAFVCSQVGAMPSLPVDVWESS